MQQRKDILNSRIAWTGLILMPPAFFAIYINITRIMMFPDALGHSVAPGRMMALQTVATFFILFTMASVCILCYYCSVRSSLSEKAKNVILSVSVFVIMLLGFECFFLHYARTNGIGARWSYKLWSKMYFTHRSVFYFTNSKGKNDRADFREPIPDLKKKKKAIWFIGDSFTYGFGLEETSQTFPALIQEKLRKRQNIANADSNDMVLSVNLGDGGADIYHEKETLFAFGKAVQQQPYAIVWQYFGDDIDSSDAGPDIYESTISKMPSERFGRRFFREKSFLLDYLYWEFFRHNEAGSYNNYIDFLNQYYRADSMVVNGKALKDSVGNYLNPFSEHLRQLTDAENYYKARGTRFLVIIFPYLWKGGPENAEGLYAQRMAELLKAKGMDVIDLTPLMKTIPLEKRIVNSHDPHPTALVDELVADTVTRYFVSKYGM